MDAHGAREIAGRKTGARYFATSRSGWWDGIQNEPVFFRSLPNTFAATGARRVDRDTNGGIITRTMLLRRYSPEVNEHPPESGDDPRPARPVQRVDDMIEFA